MATEGPLTAAQIYEQITGGAGIGSLADAQDGASHLTTRMVERAQRISALRAKTLSGWQGNAGEAAADATLPLVKAAADDAVHLETARTAVGSQMDAFGTAKNSVKPVAPQPPELTAADILHVFTGEGTGSYATKVANWQSDSQANIEAFSAYHSASSTNGVQMPAQYAQLADSGAPVSMTTPGDGTHSRTAGPTDTGEWARNPKQPQVPAQQDRQTVQPGQQQLRTQFTNQTTQNQHQVQNQVQQPGTTNTDTTHANSYVPRPVPPPAAAQGGYQFGPTGQPVSNLGDNYGGGGYTGGFGPGTGGYGSNTGSGYQPGTRTGPGTGTTPGTGRGTPGTGLRGPGPNTGARLPDERLPTNNPTRGTTGPRGANGMPMGTPVNGRGKEEDREKKKAPYLQNPDPDETFGGFIEKPMPPVIGENRPKK